MTFANTLNVSGTSALTSDNYAFNGGAASVSGSGRLTLLPYTSLANVTIGDTGVNKIPVAPFNNYAGLLAIGGNLADNSVHIGTLNVNAGLSTAGDILLVGKNNVNLQSGTTSSSGRVTVVSQTGDITRSSGKVSGGTAVLGALGKIGSSGSFIDAKSTGNSYIELYTGADAYYVLSPGQYVKSDPGLFNASYVSNFLSFGSINSPARGVSVVGDSYSYAYDGLKEFDKNISYYGSSLLSAGAIYAGGVGQLNILDAANQDVQTSINAEAVEISDSSSDSSSEEDKAEETKKDAKEGE